MKDCLEEGLEEGCVDSYLGEGQTFEEVVKEDALVLRKAGLTHKQIADALEKVLRGYNWDKKGEGFQKVCNTLSVSAVAYRGDEVCPFDSSLTASRDFFVAGIPNGNKSGRTLEEPTLVSEMLPDLIRKHHFFEGDVEYGIKPEWAIQIYRIVEKESVLVK